MKTLKQQIQELYENGRYEYMEDILQTIKEWLTQKRQEIPFGNTFSREFNSGQRIMIDELLEELK
jgi:hypothetical protein